MHYDIKKEKGFTLLEVLLALAIFSIGIMSAFSLAVSDMSSTKENYQKVRAAHLAREGIELIRNVRDSNWLKYQSNYDCDSITGGTQYCDFDYGLDDNFFVMSYNDSLATTTCAGEALDSCLNDSKIVGPSDNVCIDNQHCNLFNIDNYYVHDFTTTTLSTNLYRVMAIKKICKDSGTGAEYFEDGDTDCGAGDSKIGLEVTSRVRWGVGDKIDHIDVVAHLYDWRY